MTEDCKKILDFLNCDFELFEKNRNGAKVIARYEELCQQGQRDGFIPLLVFVSDTLAESLEIFCEEAGVPLTPQNAVALRADILQKAESVDVDNFLSQRLDEYSQMSEDYDVMGVFVDWTPDDSLYNISTIDKKTEIILAKIPTTHPWELAAWVPMGGFNDCPAPHEQVAVFKRWYHEYGAVPVLVTHAMWEMELHGKEPISSNEEAEALAKQHFAFCSDLVFTYGDNASVRGLASQLKNSHCWGFWWD